MFSVITEPCKGTKAAACVPECPVDCIYEGPEMFYIHPEECIRCDACHAACPVGAIFNVEEVPEKWKGYIQENADFFKS